MTTQKSPAVHVAVGVIENSNGEIFIAQRLPEQHQGGKWEFPGGKVESDESVQEALVRELKEECGIDVTDMAPLTVIEHQYSDKRVLLDVWWILSYDGEATQLEGQKWCWVDKNQLDAFQFPDANQPIVDCIMQSMSAY
ncbi:8-oxo-dGTP diphosphatase MutT [Idiomarina sp. X4]|uniref:8-oxo-dGTP diphosphatase MutT n=1 Tax=Idiomarina sp. X4 TaxID=2055892 RepID=UPI000C2915FA|nr:8-oxo-dGTP diphosphatase MutT [Idiomarina sp. X4]ATZ72808.1 8-oxo-dGTP diphosphatase MutT [Idiomarina sp. X4]